MNDPVDDYVSKLIAVRRGELLAWAFRPRRLSPAARAAGQTLERDAGHPLERAELPELRELKPSGELAD